MVMKIGARLTGTFAAVLVLLLAICVMVSIQMSDMNAATQNIVNDRVAKQKMAGQMREGAYAQALMIYRALDEKTPEAQRADMEQLQTQRERNADNYKSLQSLMVTKPGKAAFDRLMQARMPYSAAMNAIYAKLAANDSNGARETLINVIPVQTSLLQAQRDFGAYEETEMGDAVRHSIGSYDTARAVLWGLAALALVIATILGMLVTRSIVGPLKRVVDGANALAQGDLTAKIKVVRQDEVGSLAHALNQAISQLATIVGGVKQASLSISSATQQLASGNTDLSQRTEEQAASLEQTAASMEELTATVRNNADNAQQATTLATTASDVAQRGGEVVARVVETMHGISHSSAKVGDIINVIESIAFQTNILALNAAVEAARAGEQGRGFAVVAGEVRTLAQRSATAAKEIKDLIGESVNRVQTGSKLVEEAGSTINDVVQSVRRVTDIMGEISSASQEQRSGIEQVNLAISQMDQVTQQNAALVEEAAAAAQSMTEQARALNQSVAVFQVEDTLGDGASRASVSQRSLDRARAHPRWTDRAPSAAA